MNHSVTNRARITLQRNEHIYVRRKVADGLVNATWYCIHSVLFIPYKDKNTHKERSICMYKLYIHSLKYYSLWEIWYGWVQTMPRVCITFPSQNFPSSLPKYTRLLNSGKCLNRNLKRKRNKKGLWFPPASFKPLQDRVFFLGLFP